MIVSPEVENFNQCLERKIDWAGVEKREQERVRSKGACELSTTARSIKGGYKYRALDSVVLHAHTMYEENGISTGQ